MIEGISAVGRVDAVALTAAAALSARQTIERREKRLRWLASLARARGEPDPEAETRRELALLEDNRECIAAALDTAEEFGRLDGTPETAPDERAGGSITAADLARRIGEAGALSLRVQAHLGAASVRHLIGAENPADAVNRL